MKINNDKFNEWLEKKNITYDDNLKEYRTLHGYYMGVANTRFTTDNELIGLMVQYLLDNVRGINISKNEEDYCINTRDVVGVSTDLLRVLRNEIESIKE